MNVCIYVCSYISTFTYHTYECTYLHSLFPYAAFLTLMWLTVCSHKYECRTITLLSTLDGSLHFGRVSILSILFVTAIYFAIKRIYDNALNYEPFCSFDVLHYLMCTYVYMGTNSCIFITNHAHNHSNVFPLHPLFRNFAFKHIPFCIHTYLLSEHN